MEEEVARRLGLRPEDRTEADERLGTAYVACLAQYEAQADIEFDGEAWAPLSIDHLIVHEGITREEAEVIVQMADEEYEGK